MIARLQLKAARAVLGLGVQDVAKRLAMSASTIVKLESPGGLASARVSTVQALESFYLAQGVEFVNRDGACGVKWRAK